MPLSASTDEYLEWQQRQAQRWLPRLPWLQLSCGMLSSCTGSSAVAAVSPLQQRTADLESGALAWMARPDPLLGKAARGFAGGDGAPLAATSSAAAAVTPGVPALQPAVGATGSNQPASVFPGGGSVDAHGAAAWVAPMSAPSAGLGAFNVVGGQSLWGIPGGVGASLAAPGFASPAGGPPALLHPSPFEAAALPAAPAAPPQPALAPAGPPLRVHSSQALTGTLGQPSADSTGEQAPPLLLRQSTALAGSQGYHMWEAAGLAAAAAARGPASARAPSSQQGGSAATPPPVRSGALPGGQTPGSPSVLPAQSAALVSDPLLAADQEEVSRERLELVRHQAVAFGLAGGLSPACACLWLLPPVAPVDSVPPCWFPADRLAPAPSFASLQPSTSGTPRRPRRRPLWC